VDWDALQKGAPSQKQPARTAPFCRVRPEGKHGTPAFAAVVCTTPGTHSQAFRDISGDGISRPGLLENPCFIGNSAIHSEVPVFTSPIG
jgi:hypothetical protein